MAQGTWNVPIRRNQALTRGAPFSFFDRRFENLFDDFFNAWGTAPTRQEKSNGFTPQLDVTEDQTGLTVRAELPGIDEKDVDITLTKDALVISGEKKSEREETEGQIHYVERSYGSFQRTIPLSYEIDEEKVDASFKKGVLTIKLPKSGKAKSETKKVSIRSA